MRIARYDATMAERNALVDRAVALGPGPNPPELEAALRAIYDAEVKRLKAIAARPLKTLAELAAAARILTSLIDEDAWIEHQPALAKRIATDLAKLAAGNTSPHN